MAIDPPDRTVDEPLTVACTDCDRATDVRFLRTFAEWRGGRAVAVHRLCRGCAERWSDTPRAPGETLTPR